VLGIGTSTITGGSIEGIGVLCVGKAVIGSLVGEPVGASFGVGGLNLTIGCPGSLTIIPSVGDEDGKLVGAGEGEKEGTNEG